MNDVMREQEHWTDITWSGETWNSASGSQTSTLTELLWSSGVTSPSGPATDYQWDPSGGHWTSDGTSCQEPRGNGQAIAGSQCTGGLPFQVNHTKPFETCWRESGWIDSSHKDTSGWDSSNLDSVQNAGGKGFSGAEICPDEDSTGQVPCLGGWANDRPSATVCADRERPETRNTSKKWDPTVLGKMSYAELITKAIESSPENRLTLAQIYDWMMSSVPYFKERADSVSSAGWKNSIRHNLSLQSRFRRVSNETAGRSSWWVVDYSVRAPGQGSSGPGKTPGPGLSSTGKTLGGGRERANTLDPLSLPVTKRILEKRKIQDMGSRNTSNNETVTSQTMTSRDTAANQTSLLQTPPISWEYPYMDDSELEPKRRISAYQLPPQFVPATSTAQFASFSINFGNENRKMSQLDCAQTGKELGTDSFQENRTVRSIISEAYETIGNRTSNICDFMNVNLPDGCSIDSISENEYSTKLDNQKPREESILNHKECLSLNGNSSTQGQTVLNDKTSNEDELLFNERLITERLSSSLRYAFENINRESVGQRTTSRSRKTDNPTNKTESNTMLDRTIHDEVEDQFISGAIEAWLSGDRPSVGSASPTLPSLTESGRQGVAPCFTLGKQSRSEGSKVPRRTRRSGNICCSLEDDAAREALATLLVDDMEADGTLDTVASGLRDLIEGTRTSDPVVSSSGECQQIPNQTGSNSGNKIVEKSFVNGDKSAGGTCKLVKENLSGGLSPVGVNLGSWNESPRLNNSGGTSDMDRGRLYGGTKVPGPLNQRKNTSVMKSPEILKQGEIFSKNSTAISTKVQNSSEKETFTVNVNILPTASASIASSLTNLQTTNTRSLDFGKYFNNVTDLEMNSEEKPRRSSMPSFGCHPFFLSAFGAHTLPSQSYLEKLCRDSLFHSVLDDLDLDSNSSSNSDIEMSSNSSNRKLPKPEFKANNTSTVEPPSYSSTRELSPNVMGPNPNTMWNSDLIQAQIPDSTSENDRDVMDDVNCLSFSDWLALNAPNFDEIDTSDEPFSSSFNGLIDSIVTPLQLII